MSSFKGRIASFALGLLVSSLVVLPFIDVFKTQPYTDVDVFFEEWDGTGVTIGATFEKNGGCTLISFVAINFTGDIPKYATVTDLDGLPQAYDREEGKQGLNVYVTADPDEVDYVELRTRHRCIDAEGNETVVTKVFSRHERD